MKTVKLSLLICSHIDTNFLDMKKTLESIFSQKHVPNEIIILKNGPLSKYCLKTIEDIMKSRNNIKLITIKENLGLASALNTGLKSSTNQIIGRIDPGDIVINDRFFKQYELLKKNKEISICGSFANELFKSKKRILQKAINHNEIIKVLKFKNPIIHSSVVFRKNLIMDLGGYPLISRCQDYFLWIKCFEKDYKFFNIPEPLIEITLDKNMMSRRGFKYFMNELNIYNYMYKKKILTPYNYIFILIPRFILRIIPNLLKLKLYNLR